jgi:ketosteroid isomerase-like protein
LLHQHHDDVGPEDDSEYPAGEETRNEAEDEKHEGNYRQYRQDCARNVEHRSFHWNRSRDNIVRMEHGVRREIVKNALRQLEVELRGRDVEGVVALFREDGVLFGSEEHENAAGANELRIFLSGVFARPHTYGWSEPEPLFTGGNDELVWFVAPTTVIIQGNEGHERHAPYRVSGVLDRAVDGRWLFRLFNGSEPAAAES